MLVLIKLLKPQKSSLFVCLSVCLFVCLPVCPFFFFFLLVCLFDMHSNTYVNGSCMLRPEQRLIFTLLIFFSPLFLFRKISKKVSSLKVGKHKVIQLFV